MATVSVSNIWIAGRLGKGHDRSVSRLIKQGKTDETTQKAMQRNGKNVTMRGLTPEIGMRWAETDFIPPSGRQFFRKAYGWYHPKNCDDIHDPGGHFFPAELGEGRFDYRIEKHKF